MDSFQRNGIEEKILALCQTRFRLKNEQIGHRYDCAYIENPENALTAIQKAFAYTIAILETINCCQISYATQIPTLFHIQAKSDDVELEKMVVMHAFAPFFYYATTQNMTLQQLWSHVGWCGVTDADSSWVYPSSDDILATLSIRRWAKIQQEVWIPDNPTPAQCHPDILGSLQWLCARDLNFSDSEKNALLLEFDQRSGGSHTQLFNAHYYIYLQNPVFFKYWKFLQETILSQVSTLYIDAAREKQQPEKRYLHSLSQLVPSNLSNMYINFFYSLEYLALLGVVEILERHPETFCMPMKFKIKDGQGNQPHFRDHLKQFYLSNRKFLLENSENLEIMINKVLIRWCFDRTKKEFFQIEPLPEEVRRLLSASQADVLHDDLSPCMASRWSSHPSPAPSRSSIRDQLARRLSHQGMFVYDGRNMRQIAAPEDEIIGVITDQSVFTAFWTARAEARQQECMYMVEQTRSRVPQYLQAPQMQNMNAAFYFTLEILARLKVITISHRHASTHEPLVFMVNDTLPDKDPSQMVNYKMAIFFEVLLPPGQDITQESLLYLLDVLWFRQLEWGLDLNHSIAKKKTSQALKAKFDGMELREMTVQKMIVPMPGMFVQGAIFRNLKYVPDPQQWATAWPKSRTMQYTRMDPTSIVNSIRSAAERINAHIFTISTPVPQALFYTAPQPSSSPRPVNASPLPMRSPSPLPAMPDKASSPPISVYSSRGPSPMHSNTIPIGPHNSGTRDDTRFLLSNNSSQGIFDTSQDDFLLWPETPQSPYDYFK